MVTYRGAGTYILMGTSSSSSFGLNFPFQLLIFPIFWSWDIFPPKILDLPASLGSIPWKWFVPKNLPKMTDARNLGGPVKAKNILIRCRVNFLPTVLNIFFGKIKKVLVLLSLPNWYFRLKMVIFQFRRAWQPYECLP